MPFFLSSIPWAFTSWSPSRVPEKRQEDTDILNIADLVFSARAFTLAEWPGTQPYLPVTEVSAKLTTIDLAIPHPIPERVSSWCFLSPCSSRWTKFLLDRWSKYKPLRGRLQPGLMSSLRQFVQREQGLAPLTFASLDASDSSDFPAELRLNIYRFVLINPDSLGRHVRKIAVPMAGYKM